jgi:predicted nucleotidyltransferase
VRRRHDLIATAAAYGVMNLRVFGNVARGEDRSDSDVDLLADLPPGLSLFGLGRVEADLEAHPRRPRGPDPSTRPQAWRPGTRRA